jgi:NADPH:quinone reductase-like Zn-dependent oxidoreductase
MSKAVRIDQQGGPEQMELVDVTVGDPGPGQIRIRHQAIGLNFIDVYQRSTCRRVTAQPTPASRPVPTVRCG